MAPSARAPERCQWVGLTEALTAFVQASDGTQGQTHILPMHWYVACRLVLEGGFRPDWITPRPPFMVSKKGHAEVLHFEPESAGGGEATVFGGLKTKDIDVVVNIPVLGPCVAVSMKGTLNAYRNLTNRLEEAVGDCTNIHIAYPAMVYGFLHLFRANRPGPLPPQSAFPGDEHGQVLHKDLAIDADHAVTDFIRNYGQAMARLTGRRDLRDDVSRYEAIALLLASPYHHDLGSTVEVDGFPGEELSFSAFFETVYRQFDLRFVYGASNLRAKTKRAAWDASSPALESPLLAEYKPRVSDLQS